MKAEKEPKEKAERYCVVCRRRKRSVFWKYVPRNEKEREKWEKLLAIPGLKSQLSLCSFHFENKNSSRPLPLTRPEDYSQGDPNNLVSSTSPSPSTSTSPSPPSSPRDPNRRSFSSPLINSGSPKRRTSSISPTSISISSSSRSNSVHSRANRHSASTSLSRIPQADEIRSVTLLPHKKSNTGPNDICPMRSPGRMMNRLSLNSNDEHNPVSPISIGKPGIILPNKAFGFSSTLYPKFENICESSMFNTLSDSLSTLGETSENRLQRAREKEAPFGFSGSLLATRTTSSNPTSSGSYNYIYSGDHVDGHSARYFHEPPSPIEPSTRMSTSSEPSSRMSLSSNIHTLLSPAQGNTPFTSITEEKYQPSIPPISSFHQGPRLQQPLPNLLNEFQNSSSLHQHYLLTNNQFFPRTNVELSPSGLYSSRPIESISLRSPPSIPEPKLLTNLNFSSSMMNTALIKKAFGDFLLNGNGDQVPTEKVFSQAEVIALYFFSHSSQECCNSTHVVQFFKKMTSEGKLIEVIFISLDQEGPTFYQSIQQIPWYFIPYSDTAKRERVMKRYNIHYIPSLPYLLFLSPDGNIVKNSSEIVFSDPSGLRYPWYPRNFWRILKGAFLMDSSGSPYPIQYLQQEKCTILLYFISSRCQSCSAVTSKLKETYTILKKRCNLRVILLSTDEDLASFQNCMSICSSWLAIPFGMLAVRREIFHTYTEARAPPHLFVISSSGEILNREGLLHLSRDPEGQSFPWYPEPVNQLNRSSFQKVYHKPSLIYFHPSIEEEESVVNTLASVAAEQRAWSRRDKESSTRDEAEEIEYFFCNENEVVEELRKVTQLEFRHPTVFIMDLKMKSFSKMVLDFSGPIPHATIFSFISDWQRGAVPVNALKL